MTEVIGTRRLFLSEPRHESEILKSVLRKGQFPFTLKGYFKFGFQPCSQWISAQSRDPNRGEQSVIVGFAERYKSEEDTKDGLNILKLFLQQTLQAIGASASDPFPRPPIDHVVEWIKWTADALFADEFRDGICDMIEMLCKRGDVIDLYQDRFGAQGHPETAPDNAVELAMQSYCPSSLLENFLMYRPIGEGPLTARSKLWRRFGSDLPRGTHRAVSNMEWIVAGIHTQFYGRKFGPFTGYGERLKGFDYPDGIAEVYKIKAYLLSNDYCTDNTEREALNNLSQAVTKTQEMMPFTGRLHHSEESENEGLFRLFSAVSCLASNSYKTKCEKLTEEFGPRRHQFIINDRFDPRIEWMKYTADVKIPELQSEPGKKFRDEALDIWRRLIIERGDSRRWWEITEQGKWFVPIEDVKSSLRVANPSAADAMGL
ncbi:hypothetical protein AU210_015293 [Fusarium oxysporum f. sp. radicis-cucumerinum]|uniref:Uncharacterized protein n=1 Tax=Fusarium oxysporum f. sp. radicis-cucumerinum TaxID=327505 RepID=A0A2H3FXR7_FUSOX|nr:hypothetical protein AU210_015293 [Fusarium oxysporum f. sp. radicis-cucumerinum]RKK89655.1 hypothetical protein BFJ71_g12179 [Fusarium oxysporum]